VKPDNTHVSTGIPAGSELKRAIALITITIACITILLALYTYESSTRLTLSKPVPASWMLNWIPGLFYMLAAWSLRRTLTATCARDAALESALAAPLRRTAFWLILGAVSTTIPAAYFLSTAEGSRGTSIIFIVPAATIFCVGIGFLTLAWVLDANARLKAEARSLKSELEGFF
jgi:hypothetical protein